MLTLFHSSIESWSTLKNLDRVYTADNLYAAKVRAAQNMLTYKRSKWYFTLFEFEVSPFASISKLQEYSGSREEQDRMEAMAHDLVLFESIAQGNSINYLARPMVLNPIGAHQIRITNAKGLTDDGVQLDDLDFTILESWKNKTMKRTYNA